MRAAATAIASSLTIGALVALAGCTAMEPTATPSAVPSATVASPPPPSGDGVLRVGTLAPLSGANAALGPVHVAAVEIAVRDIGVAGGVLGAPVEVVHRDAGDAAGQKAEASFADLVARGVDVVIGPSDPSLVARLAPLAAEAGIPLLVPGAAAADAADDAPTIHLVPAVAAQAAAVARALAADGVESLAVLTGGDAEGAAVAEAIGAALAGAEIDVVVPEPLTAGTDVDALASQLREPDAGDGEEAAPRPVEAVLLATGGDLAAPTVAAAVALIEAGVDAGAVWMLGASAADHAAVAGAAGLEGARGVRAGVEADDRFRTILRQSDPGIPSFSLAPEIYDAVILAAVAAELAGDDGGASIAALLPAAAADGVPCTSFGACLDVIAQDRQPDYDGRSGLLTMDAAGDVVDARLALLRYTATGGLEPDGELGD